MIRRLFAWWFLAEAVALRLTCPRTGGGAADADVSDAVRGSRLFSWALTAVAGFEIAWCDSYARRAFDSVIRAGADGSRADRIRRAGTCIAVAAVTVLLLQMADSEPALLRWVLPLAAGVIAAAVVTAADPIARAWEAKRRR
jgi:hypothetical protein